MRRLVLVPPKEMEPNAQVDRVLGAPPWKTMVSYR